MKRCFLLFAASALLLGGCNGKSGTVDYSVNYYFEQLSGGFLRDNNISYSGKGQVGEKITVDVKDFPGFTYDAVNMRNRLVGKLDNNENKFCVYYTRNSYNIKVLGGTSSKKTGKFEEVVSVSPSFSGATPSLNANSTATITGNELKIGTEDVLLTYHIDDSYVLNNEFITSDKNVTSSVNINISEASNIQGLITLYNNDVDEEYYLFATHNTKAGFYYFSNNCLTLIKDVDVGNIRIGKHDYVTKINEHGDISCLFDGVNVLNVTESDIRSKNLLPISQYGRIGVYSKEKYFDYSHLESPIGVLSLVDTKTYYESELTKFKYKRNDFNDVTWAVSQSIEEVDLKKIPQYEIAATDVSFRVKNASSLLEILSVAKEFKSVKLNAQKEYTKDKLYSLLKTVHYSFAGHSLEVDKVTIPNTNIVLTNNYLDRDLRTWVPSIYKLRGDTDEICVLDQLEKDLENLKTSSEIYNLSDRYSMDLVRALNFRDLEFYYWQQYTLYPDTVYPVDYFVYNYSKSLKGDFTYNGNIYETYSWDKDYKLSSFIFGKPSEGGAPDLVSLICNFDFLFSNQTISNRPYKIYLNTNGGSVDSTVISTDSSKKTTLPVPTKAGCVFDGWYINRLFKGKKYTQIDQNNLNDVTLYASWKKDGINETLSVVPNDVFTENMVIQQNKPIKVFGTGIDGTTVSVNFDNQELSTLVSGGIWDVTFQPKAASFEPKVLTITGGGLTYSFNNVLIGEVWVGAGQSNMEMLFTWLNGKGSHYIGEYGDFTNLDKIRIFRQFVDDAASDVNNCDQNNWIAPKRIKDVYDKSLVSIAFACSLQEKLNVPVGIITSCRGGTYIEEWLSEENLQIAGSTLSGADKALECRYYNQMYKDLLGIEVSGVIWYQGENNYLSPTEYKTQYKQLVFQYREMFNNPNLPVIAEQLVCYGYQDYKDFRLAQWEVANELENAYCCCGIDTGEEFDIHPAEKIKISQRMAGIALEHVYLIGDDSLSYYPVSADIIDNKIVVSFENEKVLKCDGNINYLSIEKTNGSFVNVAGQIVENKIVIDKVSDAKNVCYAYGGYFENINLYGGNDKPIAPFKISIN